MLVCFLFSTVYAKTIGVKKRRLRPSDYGNVLIDNYSLRKRIPAVVFKHWLHRAKYTCRLCHVDIGFGMTAKSTEIICADIENGIYCGSCHGSVAFPNNDCQRCHTKMVY